MAGLALAGDLHLSRAIYSGKLPSMVGDSEFALSQITGHCRADGLDLVLLGDNFDKRFPDGRLVAFMLSALSGIDVGFINGQHDMQETGWPGVESGPRNRRVHLHGLSTCEVFGGDIRVSGFDFTPRHQLKDLLSSVPDDCEILCLHQLSKDVMKLDDQWTLDVEWVPSRVKYVAMGDWHGLPQEGVTADRRWFYTGSSTVRTVGEPLNKSFVVVKRGDDGGLSLCRIPLKRRPYIYNDLVWPDDLDTWLAGIADECDRAKDEAKQDGIPDEVTSPLVVCRYNVEIPEAFDRINEALARRISKQQLFLHLMPNRKFVADAPEYANQDGAVVSVQSAIDEAVDADMAPTLHRFATDLAMSSDPKSVVTAFKTKNQVVDDPTSPVS